MVGGERVFGGQLVESEALLEQRLDDLLLRLLDVDPELVLGVAPPLVDQLDAALPERAVAEEGDADGGHGRVAERRRQAQRRAEGFRRPPLSRRLVQSSSASAVYFRPWLVATASYVISPL